MPRHHLIKQRWKTQSPWHFLINGIAGFVFLFSRVKCNLETANSSKWRLNCSGGFIMFLSVTIKSKHDRRGYNMSMAVIRADHTHRLLLLHCSEKQISWCQVKTEQISHFLWRKQLFTAALWRQNSSTSFKVPYLLSLHPLQFLWLILISDVFV